MNALPCIKRPISRRLFAVAGVIVIALSTAACFGDDANQRRAFIAFLQTRIIDKPGLHIPILSAKEVADLGPYAEQYYIMSGFHHRLDAAVSQNLARAMEIGNPRSLQELVSHRAVIPVVRTGMAEMIVALDKAEADTDAAHKAPQQPPDLKAVYGTAYERMVTKPARVFRELLPMIEYMPPAIEDLATYIDQHRDVIEFRGNMPYSKDVEIRQKLSALLDAAAKAAAASAEGKRKLRTMAEGR